MDREARPRKDRALAINSALQKLDICVYYAFGVGTLSDKHKYTIGTQ